VSEGMQAEISQQWKQWGKRLMSTLSQDCPSQTTDGGIMVANQELEGGREEGSARQEDGKGASKMAWPPNAVGQVSHTSTRPVLGLEGFDRGF